MSVFFGKNSIVNLNPLISSYNARKIFMVTGDSLLEKSGAKQFIDSLPSEISICKFSDFSENPKIDDLQRGINLLKSFSAEIVIAIGGGSCIDMAKLINGLGDFDEKEIKSKIVSNGVSGKLRPLIAIPTTAGSGSEATHFAVIYFGNKKYSFANEYIKPCHVILDINLLKSLPPYQMAVSAIDAFAQSIESAWSINSNTESIQYSFEAIELIWKSLLKSMKNPSEENLTNLFKGANLSGKAINISKTTAPHALAYGFTSNYKLPHGHAVALSLPHFINLHSGINDKNCADIRGASWVLNIMHSISEILDVPFSNLADSVAGLIKSAGLELNFSNLGIDEETFKKIVSDVNIERLHNNPYKITPENILDLYKYNNLF